MDNPVEFELGAADPATLLIYPERKLLVKNAIHYANHSTHFFNGYYSVHYPILDNEVFDLWVAENLLMDQIISKKQSSEYALASERFVHRTMADFFLTFLSEDMISGYLYISSTQQAQVKTIPFLFDRNKSKFYKLEDLFKKNFDYHFFFEKYLEKIKRGRLIKENRLVQNLLKEEEYQHYVWTPQGILFFTDFHFVYGRRHILVPFEEFLGSIDNRTLESCIKKLKS